jgi:hypothetical protein
LRRRGSRLLRNLPTDGFTSTTTPSTLDQRVALGRSEAAVSVEHDIEAFRSTTPAHPGCSQRAGSRPIDLASSRAFRPTRPPTDEPMAFANLDRRLSDTAQSPVDEHPLPRR